MFAWLKTRIGRSPPGNTPRPVLPFVGVGVYFISEVHSVRHGAAWLSPDELVGTIEQVLTYQTRIIQMRGGLIEQYVGDCILAYWPPDALPAALGSAHQAAEVILRDKIRLPGLEFCLGIRFSAGELAGAFFGSGPARRFQVVGKARNRAGCLPRVNQASDFVVTDAETHGAMPEESRTAFAPTSPTTLALRIH